MSIHDIINEMSRTAEAAAKVPSLEAQVSSLQTYLKEAQEHGGSLEYSITNYKRQIEELTAKLRSVEAERDDYGFRHMQAEDTLAKLREVLGVSIDKMVSASEASVEGSVNNDPLPSSEASASISPNSPAALAAPSQTVGADVSAPVNASPSSSDIAGAITQEHMIEAHTPEQPPATLHPEPLEPPKPYAGRRYYDVPNYVSLSDWLNGGGTEDDYHWRPGMAHANQSA